MSRPSQYSANFHPDAYVKLCRQGLTRAEISAEWNISRDTLNRWEKDSSRPEFSDAIKRGDTAREAYYSRALREMAFGRIPVGNMTAFIWLTKNTLKWGDKARENDVIEIKLAYDPNQKPTRKE